MSDPGHRPTVRDDLTIVELDGEAVVYDEISAELHHLNPSATIVLSLCDGKRTVSAMAEAVSDAFGLALDDVAPQVHSVVERFAEAGLLAGV
ncbi:MAG: HPr-rel-A system PqqD family peptide chaperone [Actinomycetota bacterium]